MNRAEIDTYIARIKIEEARLRKNIPRLPGAQPVAKTLADETLERADKMLKHPGLEVLKQGVDDYERLPPDQKSQIVQLYTVWVANAQETLKVLQMLSEAVG